MKTKQGHTPGPWKFDGYSCIDNLDGKMVACLKHDMCPELTIYEKNEKEAYANARLIAGCPTMYNYIQSKAKEGDNDAKEIIRSIDE